MKKQPYENKAAKPGSNKVQAMAEANPTPDNLNMRLDAILGPDRTYEASASLAHSIMVREKKPAICFNVGDAYIVVRAREGKSAN